MVLDNEEGDMDRERLRIEEKVKSKPPEPFVRRKFCIYDTFLYRWSVELNVCYLICQLYATASFAIMCDIRQVLSI